MLRSIVERKQGFLDNLPDGAPGRMKSLQDYEFMNPEAAQKYQELMDSLRQQLMNSFFKDMGAIDPGHVGGGHGSHAGHESAT